MNNNQFYGILAVLLINTMIVDMGMLLIYDYLKEIKKLLEKHINQKLPKGE